MIDASTQGRKAKACILVLCPTVIICILYEQKVIAIAPPMASTPSIPNESISRKAPNKEIKRYVAGRLPRSKKSYIRCVKSPFVSKAKEVVGIPENIEPVQAVGSSGWAAL